MTVTNLGQTKQRGNAFFLPPNEKKKKQTNT